MENDNSGDPFHALVGRALVDEGYRNDLVSGDRDTQVAALRDAGVADPEGAIDALNEALQAIDALRGLTGGERAFVS